MFDPVTNSGSESSYYRIVPRQMLRTVPDTIPVPLGQQVIQPKPETLHTVSKIASLKLRFGVNR